MRAAAIIPLNQSYYAQVDRTADDLLLQMNALRRVIRRRVRPSIEGPQLTPGNIELLRLVEVNDGIGVSAAARGLHLAGNSVSTMVNQLVTVGLLQRSTDPRDARAAQLHLTRAAHLRLETWRTVRAALLGDGLASLPPADRQAIEQALPALARLTELLAGDQP